MRRAAIAAAAMLAGTAPALAAAPPDAVVPYVGCPGDGQLGPRRPPRQLTATPHLDPALAARLAWYGGRTVGVLAPRGWRCFEMAGTGGAFVVAMPDPPGDRLLRGRATIAGPAVMRTATFGATSGRFVVAAAAARLFPVARTFVARVEREGIEAIAPLVPGPADRLAGRAERRIDYVTPARAAGLGTWWKPADDALLPDLLPIRGTVWITRGATPDLGTIRARLAPGDADLAEAIVAH